MSMPFPALGPTGTIGAAFGIGIAFGACLERAGLGSARKLMGQFDLTDLAVFKVMFSAIITAMLGLFWLSHLGVLDVQKIYLPDTFLLPQLVGGALFGVGFALAGLCPGTSCVAAATGRLDGVGVMLGMFAGVLGTGAMLPSVESFYLATARGGLTLPRLLGIPEGIVILVIVGVALVGFGFAARVEGRALSSLSTMRRPARLLAGVALVLAVLAALVEGPRRGAAVDATGLAAEIEHEDDHITALELAQWIHDRKPGLRVLDVRGDSEFAAYHIPSAERLPLTALASLAPNRDETLVLYSEGGAHAAQGWVLLRANGHHNVYFLRGGLLDWMEDVMSPALSNDTSRARVAALSRYFGGVPRAGVAPLPTPTGPAPTAGAAVARIRRRGC